MAQIVVLAPQNGHGLEKDSRIVVDLLRQRHDVDVINTLASVLEPAKRNDYDLSIFIEVINPKYYRIGKKNIGIFNPDWFYPHQKNSFRRFQIALAKTKHSIPIFNQFPFRKRTKYIGFTSVDMYDGTPLDEKITDTILHAPGRSELKGTKQLIKLWNTRPNLPKLKIVTSMSKYKDSIKTDNIEFIDDYLPFAEFKKILNKHLYHIMPSNCEGFGHIINEARSTGAIVYTTNAPPMNELINDKIGVLLATIKTGNFNMSDFWILDESKFEIKLPENPRRMSKFARENYLNLDNYFRENFVRIVEEQLL